MKLITDLIFFAGIPFGIIALCLGSYRTGIATLSIVIVVGWLNHWHFNFHEALRDHRNPDDDSDEEIFDENATYLVGPVEKIDGKLYLHIPLAADGRRFIACCRGIGEVRGDFLDIYIRDWLAEKLGISEGSKVAINNAHGKFNIRCCEEESADSFPI